jgi:hypothetical protein
MALLKILDQAEQVARKWRSDFGGASRDRTDDLIVANDALSQLSYSPTFPGRVRGIAHLHINSACWFAQVKRRGVTELKRKRKVELFSEERQVGSARCLGASKMV